MDCLHTVRVSLVLHHLKEHFLLAFSTIFSLLVGVNTSKVFPGYSFLVRDPFGCLQAKGKVDNYDTTLQNVDGMEMLKIIEANDENEKNVHTYQISHKYRNIGTVKVEEKRSASTCLRIIHNHDYPEIVVKSFKVGEFSIYRPNSMSSPLCNMQMPYANINNSGEFNGTIIFHQETGITTEEKLLCTAAAIAFKVTMKRKTTHDNNQSKLIGFCSGIIVIILIIAAFVLFFSYMEK